MGLLHRANLIDPRRTPHLASEAQDLPIPIDSFSPHPDLTISLDDNAASIPSGLEIWVSAGPKLGPTELDRLAQKREVTGIRVNASKFASAKDLSGYLAALGSLRANWRQEPEICIDLGGPKIRVQRLAALSGREFLDIFKGDRVAVVSARDLVGVNSNRSLDEVKIIPISAQVDELCAHLDDIIFLSDGWLQMRVLKVSSTMILCESLHDCRIWDGRGVDKPGFYDRQSPVQSVDRSLLSALQGLVGTIGSFALSFTNAADDVQNLRQLLEDCSLPSRIVAKIETRAGLDNVKAIAACADAVMIARGDLAVQLAVERMDTLEVEDMIRAVCRQAGAHCIVATRVGESLEFGGDRLTLRELSRLAHELFIGPPLTVMLAQETSVGGAQAEKNYGIVVEAISRLLPSFQRQWASS